MNKYKIKFIYSNNNRNIDDIIVTSLKKELREYIKNNCKKESSNLLLKDIDMYGK